MRIVLASYFLFFLAACKPAESVADLEQNSWDTYGAAFDRPNNLLVFTLEDETDFHPILGTLKIETGLPDFDIGSILALQRALTECGESRFLIELDATHTRLISVPTKKNNPFREFNDLQLVKCVQKNVGFSFRAGVGRGLEIDQRPFEKLHAQKN